MTKTIKGWTILADRRRCPAGCKPLLGNFCSRFAAVFKSKKVARANQCGLVPGCNRLVPATLTYEVPNDNE